MTFRDAIQAPDLPRLEGQRLPQDGELLLSGALVEPDGDGSVLDHSLFVYGSGMSDSNLHFQLDLPTLMIGGAAGTAKGGLHKGYPNTTPIANLWVTVLNKIGVPTEKFGNSTGTIEYLNS